MKIIVACGGTGGHAFPGLAVAEELVRRGHEVTVWESGRDVESSVMKRWQGPVFSTGARQLKVRNALFNFASILRCRREMRRNRPDALLAMGSKAVEFLSRFADAVAISFDSTAKYLPGVKTVVTGLPVRAEIASGSRFGFIPPDSFVVFVTGGSQGAHAVNELMSKALVKMKAELDRRGAGRKLYVIHQTGAKDEAEVAAAYANAEIPARVHAFETDMASAFASADVVVARAGASTCFELAACGKPALLVPLPSAVRNHQHFNADAFASRGAADEGVQSKLDPLQACRHLLGFYDNPARLAGMSEKMKALATPDAAARVADMVEGE